MAPLPLTGSNARSVAMQLTHVAYGGCWKCLHVWQRCSASTPRRAASQNGFVNSFGTGIGLVTLLQSLIPWLASSSRGSQGCWRSTVMSRAYARAAAPSDISLTLAARRPRVPASHLSSRGHKMTTSRVLALSIGSMLFGLVLGYHPQSQQTARLRAGLAQARAWLTAETALSEARAEEIQHTSGRCARADLELRKVETALVKERQR